jgi:micrococcal nuclease
MLFIILFISILCGILFYKRNNKLTKTIGSLLIITILLAGCSDSPPSDAGVEKETELDLHKSETVQNEAKHSPKVNEQSVIDETEEKKIQISPHVDNLLNGTVTYVVDGDTLDIKFEDGREERVRLVLIDTPETKHPRKPVQPFGPEASSFIKDLLSGQDVQIELDVQERDQYGRILAYVYKDGKMVNETLLEKGLARVAVYPPNTRYVDNFREIQEKAQQDEIGIWSIENYVTDRGYSTSSIPEKTDSTIQTSCSNPVVKGNINREGEKIFHVPEGQFYEVTIAEEMFCTEQDAINSGYRKSQR